MKKLLIVDDTTVCELVINSIVAHTKLDLEVVSVKTKVDAAEQIINGDFDLFLLDLFLPAPEDGFELIDLINKKGKGVIIMCTSSTNEAYMYRCLDLGVCDYLLKGDVSVSGLRNVIQRCLYTSP